VIDALRAKLHDRATAGFPRSPGFVSALALALALAALAPVRDARAAEEIGLAWNDCGAFGVPQMVFNCPVPAFSRSMIVTAITAQDVDQVVGAAMVLDVVTDSPSLPDWWRLGPGECRAGKLGADVQYVNTLGCLDAWNGAGNALVQSYTTRPGGAANQARFIVTAGVPGPAAITATAGDLLAYARVFMYLGDSNSGTCLGCGTGACVVLNSLQLVRAPGAPGGDVTLTTPGANFATWQAGAGCATVPTRNRTWGQIKALYR
jgi:hypothetical protein